MTTRPSIDLRADIPALRVDGGRDEDRHSARFRVWMAACLAALHLLAAAFFFREGARGLPRDWPLQFLLLLACSLLLGLASWRFERKTVPAVLVGLQLFFLAAAGYPEGADCTLALILGCIFVSTLLGFTRPALPLLLAADAGVALLFRFRPVRAWDNPPILPALVDSVFLFAALSLFSAILLCVYRLSDELKVKRGQVEAMNSSISNLLGANVDFQNYAIEVGERSTIEERKRLSRDIHDIVGYTLINLKMMLESAIDLAGESNPNLSDLLARARDQAQNSLAETRFTLRAFRDIEKSNLTGVAGIHKVVTLFARATGIDVDVNYGNMPWSVNEELGLTLCRIVQEAMANSFRHGRASRIQIGFWIADGRLLVNVDDNGQGAAEIKPGIGLLGMKERLDRFGGRLEVKSADYGFSLRAEIPLQAAEIEEKELTHAR